MKDTIAELAITLGKRKNRRQKVLFINTVSKELLERGTKVQLQETKQGVSKSTNLQIGSMDTPYFLLAGYDTASKMLIPGYKYYPLDMKKNYANEKKNMLLYFVLVLAFIFVYFAFRGFASASTLNKVLRVVLALCALGIALYGIAMPTSPFNFNRNAISCCVIDKIFMEHPRTQKISAILTDYSASTNVGYKQVKEHFGAKIDSKCMIILDSLANGKEVIVATRERNKDKAESLAKLIQGQVKILSEEEADNSALGYFKNAILIFTANKKDNIYYVDNCRSKNDFKVDVDQVTRIKDGLEKFLGC